MKTITFCSIIMFIATITKAQHTDTIKLNITDSNATTPLHGGKNDAIKVSYNDDNPVFTIVQQMPSYPGGVNEFIAANTHYPEAERKKGIQGTVYVNFVVEKDGRVNSVKVLKGVANGPALDAEAVRVVSSMGKWIP